MRAKANTLLSEAIKVAFEANRQTYGSPRLHTELQEKGYFCSEKRVARLMRQSGIKVTVPRRFVVTTHSKYVWTSEGWLYLAVVLDLFSRRVVGWSMDSTMNRSLVLSAWEMAKTSRAPLPGLLCHSDRGSQYASSDYQQALREAGAVCSMSRKGNLSESRFRCVGIMPPWRVSSGA